MNPLNKSLYLCLLSTILSLPAFAAGNLHDTAIDFNGDGRTDFAVLNPDTGAWSVVESSTGTQISQSWGQSGDIPVAADYNGDGKTDFAIWRPGTGTWWVLLTSGGQLSKAWGQAGDVPVVGDYDGDGKADFAIWRPSTGTWWVLLSSGGGSSQISKVLGQAGDIPVPGDYDGDGKTDFAIWRPSTNTFTVILSSTGAQVTKVLGQPGDVPVPGDYDGDGKTDFATWTPSTGTWNVILSSTGAQLTQSWGQAGDIPAPGDYDGDGKTDFAIWRPSSGTWWVLESTGGQVSQQLGNAGDLAANTPRGYRSPKNANLAMQSNFDGDQKTDLGVWNPSAGSWTVQLSSTGAQISQAWGTSGDIPVAGDYDGDGMTDFAIWRPSTGTWWVLLSNGGQLSQTWGQSGDVPVVGDYDGDGKTDFAIWRPSTATWWVLLSNGGQTSKVLGESGDIPVPGDYDGDGKTDFAIWRPSTGTFTVVLSSSGTEITKALGQAGDIPVPGDYDGDGKTDFATWRPSTGTWTVILSSTGAEISQTWGQSGDVPVPGDYDGDGKTDFAIWRPSTGTWWVLLSNGGQVSPQLGSAGDVPVNMVSDQPQSSVSAPPTSINHVIFMMQENRTFDNYFGMLNPYRKANGWNVGDDGNEYDVDGLDGSKANISNPMDENTNPNDTTTTFTPFKLATTCTDDMSSAWLESFGDVNRYDFSTSRAMQMNGFVHNAENEAKDNGYGDTRGKRAMGYFDQGFLNYYYFMASQFAVSDRWFSPVASKTIPNRLATMTGGTTQGLVYDPSLDDKQPQLNIETIFQELDNAGVSWKIYYTDTDATDISNPPDQLPATTFEYFRYSDNYLYENPSHSACEAPTQPSSVVGDSSNSYCIDPNHIAPLSQYFTDLQNGTLPQFAYIEPGYNDGTDEHPSADVTDGQRQMANIINAFMGSSSWGDSVFFLSYDEGGGPFDHVPPVPGQSNLNTDSNLANITPDISSIAVNPDSNPSYFPCPAPIINGKQTPSTHCDLLEYNGGYANGGYADPGYRSTDAAAQEGFGAQLGFRLPNIVISPFTRRHYVSHIPMDHTAIIKFVENRFIGSSAHLTNRDAAQPNLLDFFDFNDVPWATPPNPPTPASGSCSPENF